MMPRAVAIMSIPNMAQVLVKLALRLVRGAANDSRHGPIHRPGFQRLARPVVPGERKDYITMRGEGKCQRKRIILGTSLPNNAFRQYQPQLLYCTMPNWYGNGALVRSARFSVFLLH